MTIVVYKDGIMAADSAVWSEYLHVGDTTKIVKTKSGKLVGAAGDSMTCQQFREWAQKEDGATWKSSVDDFSGIIVEPNGKISRFGGKHEQPYSYKNDFLVIGYGQDLAAGALAAGATAKKAVEIAIERHAWCAGRIDTIELEKVFS